MGMSPIFRKYHQGELSFGMWYAYSENFVLPLSHDEVVHGKGSLYGKMPGDKWQKAASLRALIGWQFGHPGKKLLFMGGEFGQVSEWNHDVSLSWHEMDDPFHSGVLAWVTTLNKFYRDTPAFWKGDFERWGFEWIDCSDADSSVFSFLRRDNEGRTFVCVGNFTPVPRMDYKIGVPEGGHWREVLNSDGAEYGGSNCGNMGGRDARNEDMHGRPYSLSLTLPPLSFSVFERDRG
jgi:1,4-alpha-glucan branching enzyme